MVLWYAGFASIVLQNECRPIDLTRYLEGELAIQASIPAGTLVDAIREEGIKTAAKEIGVDPATVKKVMNREPITFEEVVAIFRGGGVFELPADASPPERLLVEQAKQTAKSLGPTPKANR